MIALDARACVLDQFSVLNPGGACSLARAAVEAFINMVDESGSERQIALLDVDHLADAPAGRIGFEIPQTIGRTGVQA